MDNDKNVLADMRRIAETMKKDSTFEFENKNIGTIVLSNGIFGNLEKKNPGGFGIKHIVAGRYLKDRMSRKEIASLLYLIKDTAETAAPSDEDKANRNKIVLKKDDIWVVIKQNWDETEQNWIITGYGLNDSEGKIRKGVQDTIKAVNAQYSYTPEYLSLSKQVGACMTSLDNIMRQTPEDVKQKLYPKYTEPSRNQSRGGVEF